MVILLDIGPPLSSYLSSSLSTWTQYISTITYIIPIMQLTTYLIFILVLVLEAIGLGFTATHLEAFKFSQI